MERGTIVTWEWQGKKARGFVQDVYTRTVTKAVDETKMTRHGSEEEPVYLIVQEDGTSVLKRRHEVRIEHTPLREDTVL